MTGLGARAGAPSAEEVRPSSFLSRYFPPCAQSPDGMDVLQWFFANVAEPVPSQKRSRVLKKAWLRSTLTPVEPVVTAIPLPSVGAAPVPVFENVRFSIISVPVAPARFRMPKRRLKLDRLWKMTLLLAPSLS